MGNKEVGRSSDSWAKVEEKTDGTIHIYIGPRDGSNSHDHFVYDAKTGERIAAYHRGQCDECSKSSSK